MTNARLRSLLLRNSDLYVPHTLKLDLHAAADCLLEDACRSDCRHNGARTICTRHGLVHRTISPRMVIFVNAFRSGGQSVWWASMTRPVIRGDGGLPAARKGRGRPRQTSTAGPSAVRDVQPGRDRQDFPELRTQVAGVCTHTRITGHFNAVLMKACASDAAHALSIGRGDARGPGAVAGRQIGQASAPHRTAVAVITRIGLAAARVVGAGRSRLLLAPFDRPRGATSAKTKCLNS